VIGGTRFDHELRTWTSFAQPQYLPWTLQFRQLFRDPNLDFPFLEARIRMDGKYVLWIHPKMSRFCRLDTIFTDSTLKIRIHQKKLDSGCDL